MSAFFGYLKGVQNELALKHIPHVKPRNDTLAGPVGRMGDMVSQSLSEGSATSSCSSPQQQITASASFHLCIALQTGFLFDTQLVM